jgi:hypothetical protein
MQAILDELSSPSVVIVIKKKPHHQTFDSLNAAVGKKCRICTVFLQTMFANYQEDELDLSAQPFTTWETPDASDGNGTLSLHLNNVLALIKPMDVVIINFSQKEICSIEGTGFSCTAGIKAATSTADESVLDLARVWLSNCVVSHNSCANKLDKTWSPKRLLYIQGAKIRLLDTRNENPAGPYATLSHCWGKERNFVVLSESNIGKFLNEIPPGTLPKTFAEAIDIVYRLGISYLWIDSLCILQAGPGSRQDWLEHATQMAYVYQNCILNISADAAQGPNDGCYSTRDPALISELRLPAGFNTTTIHLDRLCGFKSLQSTTLSKRGWVVQERLLSPRVLHMGPLQISWECREMLSACECHPNGAPEDGTGFPFVLDASRLAAGPEERIRYSYYRIVQHYTACNLSFPDTDKLVAFAAIAQQASTLLNDQYIAGSFWSNLPVQLLWTISETGLGSRMSCRAKGEYRAPSWSWASIDGPISLKDGPVEVWSNIIKPETILAELLEYQADLIDPQNPFGGVACGTRITLSGYLLPLDPNLSRDHFGSYMQLSTFTDVTKPSPHENGNEYFRVIMDELECSFPVERGGGLFFFPILISDPFNSPAHHRVSGLILMKSSQPEGYCRVGYGRRDGDFGRFLAMIRRLEVQRFDIY